VGLASWYGRPYHGRRSASGEIYNMNAQTAAHRTLPFQTWVRVTNLENKRVTNVRINDRGPFIEGRIIDLSRAAAEAINMVGTGTALVRVEVVQTAPGEPNPRARYAVQVGAFLVKENALALQSDLEERFGDVFIESHRAPEGRYYRVRVGHNRSREEAEALAEQLRQETNLPLAMVVRLD
jgi:rare lipoprotein A